MMRSVGSMCAMVQTAPSCCYARPCNLARPNAILPQPLLSHNEAKLRLGHERPLPFKLMPEIGLSLKTNIFVYNPSANRRQETSSPFSLPNTRDTLATG